MVVLAGAVEWARGFLWSSVLNVLRTVSAPKCQSAAGNAQRRPAMAAHAEHGMQRLSRPASQANAGTEGNARGDGNQACSGTEGTTRGDGNQAVARASIRLGPLSCVCMRTQLHTLHTCARAPLHTHPHPHPTCFAHTRVRARAPLAQQRHNLWECVGWQQGVVDLAGNLEVHLWGRCSTYARVLAHK